MEHQFDVNRILCTKCGATREMIEDGDPCGHHVDCFVYRHAPRLLGVDRAGLCTCGLQPRRPDTACEECMFESGDRVFIVPGFRCKLHTLKALLEKPHG